MLRQLPWAPLILASLWGGMANLPLRCEGQQILSEPVCAGDR